MSEPSPAPGQGGGITLPELTQAVLDRDTLYSLFNDIACLTRVVSVTPRRAPGEQVGNAAIGLEEARDALLGGTLRGVQIRYLHDGIPWCDTLIAAPGGARIVRMRDESPR